MKMLLFAVLFPFYSQASLTVYCDEPGLFQGQTSIPYILTYSDQRKIETPHHWIGSMEDYFRFVLTEYSPGYLSYSRSLLGNLKTSHRKFLPSPQPLLAAPPREMIDLLPTGCQIPGQDQIRELIRFESETASQRLYSFDAQLMGELDKVQIFYNLLTAYFSEVMEPDYYSQINLVNFIMTDRSGDVRYHRAVARHFGLPLPFRPSTKDSVGSGLCEKGPNKVRFSTPRIVNPKCYNIEAIAKEECAKHEANFVHFNCEACSSFSNPPQECYE